MSNSSIVTRVEATRRSPLGRRTAAGAGADKRASLPPRSRLLQLIQRKFSFALPLSALVVAFLIVCAVVPGWVAPYSATDYDYNAILQPPSLHHWFGTDSYGRDVASLVIFGARASMLIGATSVALGISTAALTGISTGYAGGAFDAVVMRFVEVWMSIPPLLLAMIIALALGNGFVGLIIAIASMIVPGNIRILRSQVIAVKARPFVLASRTLGASPGWVLLRHILPHTLPLLLVLATLALAESVLMGSVLSFIGIGVISDRPDWGFLLSQGRGYLTVAWWFATFPGVILTALTVSVNLLGDALRQRFDGRSRKD